LEGDGVQASYFNSLKEAAYVLTGSSSSVMTLTKASQQELWQNVLEAKDEEFFSNLSKMDLTRPTRSRIPVRVYCREKVFDSFTGWKSVEYASKSVVLDSEDAEDLTPRGVLQRCLGVALDGEAGSGREVVAAGVELESDTNLANVYPHLKNADMWLYLVVRPSSRA